LQCIYIIKLIRAMFKKFINHIFYSLYWIERNTAGWWGKNKNGISEYQTYDILISLKISLSVIFTGMFLTAVILES